MEGAIAQVCAGAGEALRVLQAESVDILISDIAMPDIDGCTFITQVRGMAGRESLPAIALSGLGRPEDAERAIGAGFHMFLSKPVAIEPLLSNILKLCAQQTGTATE